MLFYEKKGQIALFLIIGLLLVGSVITIFLFSMKINNKDKQTIQKIDSQTYENMKLCVEQSYS